MALSFNAECHNIEDLEKKLTKYIKIELLDDTDSYFVGGKLTRYQTIATNLKWLAGKKFIS